jgi:hypothetical protein
MNTLIKTADIRIAYKVIIWLLLSNNIAGIALNPKMFLASLLFLVGVPGVILIIHYFISSLRKKPVMYFLPHLGALFFNIFILHVIDEMSVGSDIVGSLIWPYINIGLSAIALALIIINIFLIPPYNNEN